MADLTHWDPFGELFSIRDSVNRMFNGQYWQPTVDIADRREELILRADLPGERVQCAALGGAGPAGHQYSTSMRSIAAWRSALDGRL